MALDILHGAYSFGNLIFFSLELAFKIVIFDASATNSTQREGIIHCVHKNGPPFYFSSNCRKLADFNAFWCGNSQENLTLTAYAFAHLTLYTLTTLPWEIQNSQVH